LNLEPEMTDGLVVDRQRRVIIAMWMGLDTDMD